MESSLTSDSTGRASNRLLSMKKLARRLIAAIHIEAAKTSHNARLPFTSFDHESVFNFLVVDWTNDWRHPVLTRFSAAHLTRKVSVIWTKLRTECSLSDLIMKMEADFNPKAQDVVVNVGRKG